MFRRLQEGPLAMQSCVNWFPALFSRPCHREPQSRFKTGLVETTEFAIFAKQSSICVGSNDVVLLREIAWDLHRSPLLIYFTSSLLVNRTMFWFKISSTLKIWTLMIIFYSNNQFFCFTNYKYSVSCSCSELFWANLFKLIAHGWPSWNFLWGVASPHCSQNLCVVSFFFV
jgi:hypothetical protein